MRSSSNDPIQVAMLVEADHGLPGRIGLTIAPGKKDAPRKWDRDVDADLTRLRHHFSTDMLVSLLEPHEYELLHIPQLIERALAQGMETMRVPMKDVSVPKSPRELDGPVIEILSRVAQGATVVIHCRGGIGRSGVLAASCLVATGVEPDEAIERVRRVRPGAVETHQQEAWVRAFRSPRPALDAAQLDRLRGCLLGGAMGDTLGYPVEFMSTSAIKKEHGAEVPTHLAFAGAAVVSDDTQMTLFTAEGFIRAAQRMRERGICNPINVLKGAYVRWYHTQTGADVEGEYRGWLVGERRLWVQRAPGNTCMSALRKLSDKGAALPSVDSPPNDSKGCGAVMRSAPIGMGVSSRERSFSMARDAGVLTHGHPSGYLSAAYFAALITDVLEDVPLAVAMESAAELCRLERGHEELLSIIERATRLAAKGPPSAATIEALGGGWTGEEALAIALLCTLTADTTSPTGIKAALWRAAAHTGD
ncbi:MAG: ADP-ribosylglycohydrolase family protein, partial [Polyangia bacterium]